MSWYETLIYPFEWLVSWIMYGFHTVLTAAGMPSASGWTWTLSIVGLVLVMRGAMIPLFVKQIHASRKMQMIQPELQKIQKKYKGKNDPESRQAMTQETMELYKKEGTNPFSSCLPILAQSPFFFGLFRLLYGLGPIAAGTKDSVGPITKSVAAEAESATIFGAPLSASFLGTDILNAKILTVILIIWMSATTFIMQRQLMMKNMPASAMDNPFAKQQKVLLYVLPVIFAISGVNFPIGVLLYWFTTNLWTIAQQTYVIRRMPTPGSAAEKAYHERLARKGKPVPGLAAPGVVGEEAEDAGTASEADRGSGQRQQPTGKKRAKKKGQQRPPGAPGAPGQADAAGGPGAGAPGTD